MVSESSAVAVAAPTTAATCVCAVCSMLFQNHWALTILYAAILITCAAVCIQIIISCWRDRKKQEAKREARNRKCGCDIQS